MTRLQDIAKQLEAGEAQTASPREILGWFHAERRGERIVDDIDQEMRRARIKTVPHINDVYIDVKVAFALLPLPPVPATPEIPAPPQKCTTAIRRAPHVGLLSAANRVPISVSPDSPIAAAVSIMMVYDYSQLPIMIGRRTVKGLFSWKSYGRALSLGGTPATVMDAAQTDVTILDETTDLIEAIPSVSLHEVALVRANNEEIKGIITTTDLSLEFRTLTEPFILIGDIENSLRALLNDRFTLEEIRSALDPRHDPARTNGIEDLNFSTYVALLGGEERWKRVGVPLERGPVLKALDRVREIRNDVMHFSPDPIDESSLTHLRSTKNVLMDIRTAAGC